MANNKSEDHYKDDLAHFYKLIDTQQNLGRDFTKYLLMFSSGAIGLSITLVGNIFNSGPLSYIYWLLFSWILFLFCIALTLCSITKSIKAFEEEINAIAKDVSEKGHITPREGDSKLSKSSKKLDKWAAICFIF